MHDSPQSLADRLHEEGFRVIDFFKDLTDEQWGIDIYPNAGNWTMHHLLAHCVSSETGRRELISNIISGGKGSPPGFDIDAFNHQEVDKLSANTNDSLLELFAQERGKLVVLVSGLTSADLGKVGNDPFLGEVALLEMIKLTYRHLQIHLREARRYL